MLWRGRRQSDNIDDQRGGGGLGGGLGGGPGRIRIGPGIGTAGGGGLSGILILVVLFFVLRACGIDPMAVLTGDETGDADRRSRRHPVRRAAAMPRASDEMKQFVATVLAETEDTWNGIFQAKGQTYEEPRLVLVLAGRSGRPAVLPRRRRGRSIAPSDHKVYLDTDFFEQLDQPVRRFGRFRRRPM